MNARRAIVLILTLIFALSGCAGGPREAAPAMPGTPSLASAQVLVRVPEDPTLAFRITFAVGSQDDPPGKEGLAFLTAMAMAEGSTAEHSYAEVLEILYPMAAGYGVRVDRERTTFSGRVHRDNLDAYVPLLLDAILRPAFAADDFQRIKQRTIDGIEKSLRYSSDEELGKAVFHTAVFAGTPYGHIEEGTVAGLDAISLDDLRAFHRRRFTRETVTLGIGGGFDDGLVARLRTALAALPPGRPDPVPPPAPAPIEGRRLVIVEKPGPATAISFGFPISVLRGERDFYALWIANSWLGEHRQSASHLYQVLREARGMNYGDYSYIEYFPEGGGRDVPPPGVPRRKQLFEVWIRPVPNEQAHFALRAAVRELERLVADGLSQEEFEFTRRFLSKFCLHYAPTTAARLGYAIDDRFYGIPAPGHLARFRAMMADLTRDEVNAAIRKHLRPENMVIAMVSAEAKRLADAIAGETPSPISYATPKPPEILSEDREIATYPLRIPRDAIRIVPVDDVFAR
ncbi:MAG: insulinase family protein [Planctomycetes bacterium]|nr:insulinase family protein [Planctomycetota bacterium]